MKRLTKKDYDGMLFWYRNKGGWRMEEIDKLGRYEDVDPRPNYLRKMKKEYLKYKELEEGLGIDLITLFKALKNGGVYVKNGFTEDTPIKMRSFQICGDDNGITIWSQVKLNAKDYGKTWALTKEELE